MQYKIQDTRVLLNQYKDYMDVQLRYDQKKKQNKQKLC